MKKSFIKFTCLSVITALILGFTGCTFAKEFKQGFKEGYNNEQQKETKNQDLNKEAPEKNYPKVVKSTNGTLQLSVPNAWIEDDRLNSEADVQVSNAPQEKYVIVISDSLSDFSDNTKVDDFAKLVKSNMSSSIKNTEVSDFSNISINGLQARYFEVQGEVENLKVRYMIAAIKGKKGFYQVIGWTLNSKYDQNKSEIINVITSFKEVEKT